jgi:tRNA (guanine-N7-)-methyltransferase
VQQEFLHILQKTLSPGGEFLFKTDHPEYFEWVIEQVEEFNTANAQKPFTQLVWSEQGDFFYPKTDFQELWEGQGKNILQIRYNNGPQIFAS